MPQPWQSFRWALRRRLRRLRRDARIAAPETKAILYLFAGTYGDFVQILRPMEALAAACPRARIFLLAPRPLTAPFNAFLPESVHRIGLLQALLLCLGGKIDILLGNAVGVFRVRFEVLACLGGRVALGFRHAEEKRRRAYTSTLPLTPAVRNFESANLALLRLAGVSSPSTQAPSKARENPSHRVLFHVGSAGFRRSTGTEKYLGLIRDILQALPGHVEEILYGPGDEDIAERLRVEHPSLPMHCPDLKHLAEKLRNHEGPVLCFNSFFAHFCRYIGVSAHVIHRERVPYGYDCNPPHFQFVLPAEGPWDLAPLLDALSAIHPGSRPPIRA